MSLPIIALVLAAAALHASWNIIVKGGSNKFYEIGMNALGGGMGAAFILPFAPFPASACLPYLAASCCCHLLYYIGVAAAYKAADLSLGYTIMRGTAPMLTAFAMSALGAPLGLYGWSGVILLCSGIFALALQQRLMDKGSLKGVLLSLRVSFLIMGYTLADGLGARLSGDSAGYACWLFFLNMFPLNIYILARNGKTYIHYLKGRALIGLSGGLCGLASYGIAIWAMTKAPIALVAALRESSVIFGMILAVIFLHEKLTPLRIFAVLLVAAGAMCVRLG